MYGYTITAVGQELLTSLLAESTLQYTRVSAGGGQLPEGADPADLTDVIDYVCDGTTTEPLREGRTVSMTVEFRSDLVRLPEDTMITNFGIFGRVDGGEETLLMICLLGNKPHYLAGYNPESMNGVDIHQFPITMMLSAEANVTIAYPALAFPSYEDVTKFINVTIFPEMKGRLQELVDQHNADAKAHKNIIDAAIGAQMSNMSAAHISDITIPASAWAEDVDSPGEYVADVAVEESTAKHVANVALDKPSLAEASQSGLLPLSETLAGLVRLRAGRAPKSDLTGTLTLISPSASASTGGGGGYVLPAASSTTLGGVMVKPGSGLTVAGDGSLGLDVAAEAAVREAVSGEGEAEG